MLHPTHLRDLDVDPAHHPRGQPHVSAASGLVVVHGVAHLVADDEHHLGVFAIDDGTHPVRLHRLFPGDLPTAQAERKRRKPDLEALAAVPGGLLALGSGSTPQRERGVLLPLHAGAVAAPRLIDLAPLYAPLRTRFGDLNIEGAFAAGDGFHLLQRANRGNPLNALVRYALRDLLAWLAGSGDVPAVAAISPLVLDNVDGIPYGITDGAPLPGGGWIFSAVAEDTQDSYADGRCAGSMLGWVDAHGAVLECRQLAGAPKVEGVSYDGAGRVLLVTDADDPGVASQLLQVRWPALPHGPI